MLEKFNWRDHDGKIWTTANRNQGSANNTCVAFGVLAVLETLLKIHYYNNPDQFLDLSECNLWTCGHQWFYKEKLDSDCHVWNNDPQTFGPTATWNDLYAMQYLQKFGVASGIDSTWPAKCECADPSPNTRIKDFQSMTPPVPNDFLDLLKEHLVKKGPFITERNLSQGGTHVIAIVGYDNSTQKFDVKDSLDHAFETIDYAVVLTKRKWGWIEVYKPILNINIPDISGPSEPSELSLKIVKTAPTNLGNLADVDPTVLPNLQSEYNASYDRASGWLTIKKESIKVLPLNLAVPPGKYDIYVKISNHLYFGFADVGPTDVKNTVSITLREFTAPLYFIYVKHSEKCLEVRYAAQEPDVDVIQNAYQGGSHQMFRFVEPPSDGYYRIDAQCSGLCLDIRGNVSDEGARLIQYIDKEKKAHTEKDLFNQRFKMVPILDDPGYFRIVVRHSGKYLDINNATLRDGANVVQKSLNENSLSQRFRREPVIL